MIRFECDSGPLLGVQSTHMERRLSCVSSLLLVIRIPISCCLQGRKLPCSGQSSVSTFVFLFPRYGLFSLPANTTLLLMLPEHIQTPIAADTLVKSVYYDTPVFTLQIMSSAFHKAAHFPGLCWSIRSWSGCLLLLSYLESSIILMLVACTISYVHS